MHKETNKRENNVDYKFGLKSLKYVEWVIPELENSKYVIQMWIEMELMYGHVKHTEPGNNTHLPRCDIYTV